MNQKSKRYAFSIPEAYLRFSIRCVTASAVLNYSG